MPRRTRSVLTVALPLAVLTGYAGCGDDADDVGGATTATTADVVDASTTTTGGDEAPTTATPGQLAVTAVDYAYEGLPGTIAAGSSLTLTNGSAAEVHELVAFLLPGEERRSADDLMALSEAELNGVVAGAPRLVLVAPPSSAGFAAVGDGTLGEPGRYLYFCAIPVGADPGAYLAAAQAAQGGPIDVPGGPPHFVEGMYGEVTVE